MTDTSTINGESQATQSPAFAPPSDAAEADSGAGAPSTPIEELGSSFGQSAAESDAPTFVPPEAVSAGEEQGITAWHTKKVTGLWCNSASKNAYAAIEGVGWRRVNNANTSAFLTMTALLSLARQTGVACRVRIESDNKIHEVFAF